MDEKSKKPFGKPQVEVLGPVVDPSGLPEQEESEAVS
jgi:hypothetical protein